MKIAFLGTPSFALPSLRMLIQSGHALCIFTQPDKPVGRKAVMTPPPVKALAQEHGLPVVQPERIRAEEGMSALRAFGPDLMVTVAFGQILSEENLAVPKLGCINVHGSLLPQYRGAAPIQWAVINGEGRTGVTTMMTDVGLDTGDILLTRETRIDPDETAGELYARMAELGAKLLQETLERLQAGTLPRIPQDHAAATKCGILCKEDGRLDFTRDARWIHNRVRGTNPWPGAFAMLEGQPLKIWRTSIADVQMPEGLPPGSCFLSQGHRVYIACREGAVELLELQAPGGKRMEAAAYLRGKPLDGVRLL